MTATSKKEQVRALANGRRTAGEIAAMVGCSATYAGRVLVWCRREGLLSDAPPCDELAGVLAGLKQLAWEGRFGR